MTNKALSRVGTNRPAPGFVHPVNKIAIDRVIHVADSDARFSACPLSGQANVATSRRFIQQA